MSSDIKDTSSNNNNDINNKKKLNNIEELSKLLADDILNIIKNNLSNNEIQNIMLLEPEALDCQTKFRCADHKCQSF
jgi:hypothetical protein